ncbi:MAG: DUF4097 domain-containing protein [Ruminococcus sp.]|nr:DUF4097 domain-containing protein [Ruminococcus sp.]
MKKSALNRIIIWSIVSAVLILLLILGVIYSKNIPVKINGDTIRNKHNNLSDFNRSTNAKLTDDININAINVGWISGNVEFVTGDTDNITINQSFGNTSTPDTDDTMLWYVDDDKLYIYSNDYENDFAEYFDNNVSISSIFSYISKSFNKRNHDSTLTVSIPENYILGNAKIDTVSANVSVSNLKSDLTINTVSGIITTDNINADDVTINDVSGNIDINIENAAQVNLNNVSGNTYFVGCTDEIEISTVSGKSDCNINNSEISDIRINSISGNNTLTLPKDITGFYIDYSTTSGKLSNNFSNNNTYSYGDEYINISCDTVSGNFDILKK